MSKKCYSYVMCTMLGYTRTNYHIEVRVIFFTGKMLVNSHQIKHTGQKVSSPLGMLLRSIAKMTTKAKISRNNLMEYIHEDRDLLMGLQDDLSDMLFATGKFSITLDEIVNEYMPHIPLYLIENEDEIKETYSDRIDEDDNLFIFDRDKIPNEITLNVEWTK